MIYAAGVATLPAASATALQTQRRATVAPAVSHGPRRDHACERYQHRQGQQLHRCGLPPGYCRDLPPDHRAVRRRRSQPGIARRGCGSEYGRRPGGGDHQRRGQRLPGCPVVVPFADRAHDEDRSHPDQPQSARAAVGASSGDRRGPPADRRPLSAGWRERAGDGRNPRKTRAMARGERRARGGTRPVRRKWRTF